MDAVEPVTVSVVIPCYNMSSFVRVAVESVLSQTVPVHEVIVVDDGSTDDPAAALATIDDPRLRVVRTPNGGTARARNVGSELATGSHVAFLDADDSWYSPKLERQLALLCKEPLAVAVGAQMHHVGSRGSPVGITGVDALDDKIRQSVRTAELMPFPISTLVVTRKSFQDVGGFDQSLRLVQDLDFVARLATQGQVLTVGEPLGAYRVHPESASARQYRNQRQAARFVRARISARNDGHDLTLQEFLARHPTESKREWFDDTARSLYRAAGVLAADKRYVGASWRLGASVLMQPSYAISRMRQQRVFTYLRGSRRSRAAVGPKP